MVIEIDSDTILRQVATDDLVYELYCRSKEKDLKDLSLDGVIAILQMTGCPKDILKPLEGWAFSKVVTQTDLDNWLKLTS